MKAFWTSISNTGITPGLPKELVKKVKITNQIVFTLSLIASSYLFIFYFLGYKEEGLAVGFVVASMIAPLFLNRYQLFSVARIWFLVAINLAVLIYSNIFGTDAGIRLAYFIRQPALAHLRV